MYNALIIDDHPLIAEAYKSAFNFVGSKNNWTFTIETASNCDEALACIKNYQGNAKKLDIVFLDISLPPSKDKTILSGEDLGLLINKNLPATKVIVSTTFNDNYRVHSILKNLNPDGFLIKNDIVSVELVQAIEDVITDPPYYSKTVTKLLRNEVSNDLLLDDIDRKILYEISIGTRMKSIPDVVALSMTAVEKRKRRIKQIFDLKSTAEDKDLIISAKEKGFL